MLVRIFPVPVHTPIFRGTNRMLRDGMERDQDSVLEADVPQCGVAEEDVVFGAVTGVLRNFDEIGLPEARPGRTSSISNRALPSDGESSEHPIHTDMKSTALASCILASCGGAKKTLQPPLRKAETSLTRQPTLTPESWKAMASGHSSANPTPFGTASRSSAISAHSRKNGRDSFQR